MEYMSNKAGRKVVQLLITGMVVLLVVVGYVFYRDDRARAEVVKAARSACELTKQDRVDTAVLNENMLRAFRDTDSIIDGVSSPERRSALLAIGTKTRALKARSKINCNESFPKASFFP